MAEPDWLRLQKMIFARYVQQRLREAGDKREVKDIVKEMADGTLMVDLLEVMSGHKMAKKPKPTTVRIKMVNNVNEALKFAESCGLDIPKIRVQAEDLIDGNEKVVLALVFAIIGKYMKFEDDDDEKSENVDVRDALVLWLKNKTDGYAGINIEKKNGKLVPKNFHDGCVLLALVNKMRPKLVDYASVSPGNGPANVAQALDLGEKYLKIDKYITPEDIPKLDELSMIVYLSDWYYGVFLLMKQDIAARRVGKLVNITELHDKMRVEYTEKATAIRSWVDAKISELEKREFDDTLAGIKAKLETFYAYKGAEKADWVGKNLDSNGLFNNLALRLANNRRPAWVPPAGTSPSELDAKFSELETVETRRSVDLNAELARQVLLHKLYKRFSASTDKVISWIAEKKVYVDLEEPIDNVEPAEDALEVLDIYDKEFTHIQSSQVADINSLAAKLIEERFEHSGDVTSKRSEVETGCSGLLSGAATKRSRLEAELQKQKDINESLCKAFADSAKAFLAWMTEMRATLSAPEGTSLEQQLADLKAGSANSGDAEAKLVDLTDSDSKVADRGITVNPHTNITLSDLKAQWTQYGLLVRKKEELLNEQIEEAARGGLSEEQITEIDENFNYFDKDKNGFLTKKEIRGCLQSLGEESTPKDIAALLETYDTDKSGTIKKDEFTNFMKKQMGDSGLEDQLITSFKYLCYDKDHILEGEMTNVVNDKTFRDSHVDYLKTNMATKDAGYDYATWTHEAFLR